MSSRRVIHDTIIALRIRRRSCAPATEHPSSPHGVYAATPDYAHALEVRDPRRLLFVAGTMGLDAAGDRAAHARREQLDLVWANLRAILARPA